MSSKKLIIAGVATGLLTTFGFGYYLYKKTQEIVKKSYNEEEQNTNEKIKNLIESYYEKQEDNHLTKNSVLKIYNLWSSIIFLHFQSLLNLHRQERREFLAIPEKYMVSCKKYFTSLHSMFTASYKNLVSSFPTKLTEEKWRVSLKTNFKVDDENSEFTILEAFLKHRLTVKNKLILPQAKDVFRKLISLLKELDMSYFFEYLENNKDGQEKVIAMVIKEYIFDKLHELLNYEKEDYFFLINNAKIADRESSILFDEYNDLINTVLAKLPSYRVSFTF